MLTCRQHCLYRFAFGICIGCIGAVYNGGPFHCFVCFLDLYCHFWCKNSPSSIACQLGNGEGIWMGSFLCFVDNIQAIRKCQSNVSRPICRFHGKTARLIAHDANGGYYCLECTCSTVSSQNGKCSVWRQSVHLLTNHLCCPLKMLWVNLLITIAWCCPNAQV